MNQNLLESLRTLAAEVTEQAGVRLFDLEYDGHAVRVFIESETGVTIDTCQKVSQALSARLDQSNLILGRYFLEVSSPGLERKLRGIDDFRHAQGKFAHVVSTQGALDGTIAQVEDDKVVLALPESDGSQREVAVACGNIRRANLKVRDDELFARQGKRKAEARRAEIMEGGMDFRRLDE